LGDLDLALKKEEALHYFVRNRKYSGVERDDIQKEWLEVTEKIETDAEALDVLYKKEKLRVLVISTRQALEYPTDVTEGILKRVCSPFD
jgi:AICAR transformylase/IMP cyclohydrolase PurH